jgi:CheY-like chemotaxis protein
MAKKVIMVVDDEPDVCKLVSDILRGEGYEPVVANSGKEALKRLEKIKPDLMLLDFFMPEMSGRELCVKIRADPRFKKIKIAFLTVAQFSIKGQDNLNRMNVLDYIQKPFDYKELVKRVKKMLI